MKNGPVSLKIESIRLSNPLLGRRLFHFKPTKTGITPFYAINIEVLDANIEKHKKNIPQQKRHSSQACQSHAGESVETGTCVQRGTQDEP